MSNIIEKINSAKLVWYWSLKPGKYVDRTTGVEPNLDIVSVPFTGTLESWNQSLLSACMEMSKLLSGDSESKYAINMPSSLYSRMTPSNIQSLSTNVAINENLPYNICLIESGQACGIIKILNINDKGNLV